MEERGFITKESEDGPVYIYQDYMVYDVDADSYVDVADADTATLYKLATSEFDALSQSARLAVDILYERVSWYEEVGFAQELV